MPLFQCNYSFYSTHLYFILIVGAFCFDSSSPFSFSYTRKDCDIAVRDSGEGINPEIYSPRSNINKLVVIVSIRDSGEGINPEIYPRLFTKFATKSYSGTGLGLYISKSIIEAHGGKMWGENNRDGPGATFTFTLPICDSNDNKHHYQENAQEQKK